MRSSTFVAAAVVLATATASAQVPTPVVPLPVCAAVAPTQAASCLAAHYSEIDRLLGDAYKVALARIAASGLGKNLIMDWRRALQETQRKWIAYREADCGPPIAYETAAVPATTAVTQLTCKIALTESRLSVLATRYPTAAR